MGDANSVVSMLSLCDREFQWGRAYTYLDMYIHGKRRKITFVQFTFDKSSVKVAVRCTMTPFHWPQSYARVMIKSKIKL